MESVKICRFKTFWVRIFARGTLLLFRCFDIHVKMCILLILCWKMSLKDVFTSAQTIILRDGVCQNLSFQNIFGENFCTENLVSV